MINYIPPDIPPAVVRFADKYYKNNNDIRGYWLKYLTVWKGSLEVYAAGRINQSNADKTFKLTGLPTVFLYDCHDVRRPTLTEVRDIHWFMPKYITSSEIKSEHLCHRDLESFNQHTVPNPYNKKVKYLTPGYIPKTVIEYANQMYPISWQPGAYYRYIRYLTVYENKYEVYFLYWDEPHNNNRSKKKYILYDCRNAREYQNNKERVDLESLGSGNYDSLAKPTFCSSKIK